MSAVTAGSPTPSATTSSAAPWSGSTPGMSPDPGTSPPSNGRPSPRPGCAWTYSAETHPASPAPAGTMLVSWASSHDDPGTTCDMQPQFTDLPIGSPLPCRAGGPHRAAASGGHGNEPER